MTYSTHERGGVLLYAVIAVAFLSGLSLYLQKMSDPKIFQTNDTQKILNTEYLAESMGTLLSITATNNPNLLKNENDIIDPSTNNVTANFISKTKQLLTEQEKVFLFSKDELLIASAAKKSKIQDTDLDFIFISRQPLKMQTSAYISYNIKSISTNSTQKLKILLHHQE